MSLASLVDRLKIREIAANGSSKYVPPHVNIFYCFGGLVFTSFVAQITTGAAMTFNYVPEVSRSLADHSEMLAAFVEERQQLLNATTAGEM